ncbi:MAG: ECF-type sigma factor, partial [Acidobacteriota bacterium]
MPSDQRDAGTVEASLEQTLGAGVSHLLTRDDAPQLDDDTVTRWLRHWHSGSDSAVEHLVPLVYRELRRIAGRLMVGERHGTLQPTALVHEAFLRLVDQRRLNFRDRGHFFAVAVRIMRRVIVDHARARSSWKRGGREDKVPINEALDAFEARSDEFVALDDALDDLARVEPQRAMILELRVFGGLTQEETAELMGISRPTVTRQYRLAKA